MTEGRYPPGLRIGRHDHEQASVSIVLAGGYDERFGRRHRRATPGLVIIHPEGEHHDETHDSVETTVLTVEIAGGLLRTLQPVARCLADASDRRVHGAIVSAYRLRAELWSTDATSQAVIDSLALDLIGNLGDDTLANAAGARWLMLVRDRLLAEAASAPPMSVLAEMAGVHPVHLARAFRRVFGCSIGTYVRQRQIATALLAIEAGRSSLAAIACDAGFADQSHMTRLMRNATGLTPGMWRTATARAYC